jgi:hypothetical protein
LFIFTFSIASPDERVVVHLSAHLIPDLARLVAGYLRRPFSFMFLCSVAYLFFSLCFSVGAGPD